MEGDGDRGRGKKGDGPTGVILGFPPCRAPVLVYRSKLPVPTLPTLVFVSTLNSRILHGEGW